MTTSTAGNVAGATGGYAIATTLMTASFIDLLRNKATIMRLSRTLAGLVGNIDIPKQTAGATGYWIGEDEDAGETGIELGQIGMTPRTVAAYSEITRKLLIQDSLDCEALVRSDLAIAMALTIDKAGYYGTGSANQPRGIANYAGINAVPFVGVQPTYPEVVQMETVISTDNADVETMSFVGDAAFRGHSARRPSSLRTSPARFGSPVIRSTAIPCRSPIRSAGATCSTATSATCSSAPGAVWN